MPKENRTTFDRFRFLYQKGKKIMDLKLENTCLIYKSSMQINIIELTFD